MDHLIAVALWAICPAAFVFVVIGGVVLHNHRIRVSALQQWYDLTAKDE